MPGEFIGLWNYADLLEDDIFHQTAWNTMIYAVVTVPFKAVMGLGLALILNNQIRFSNPIRAFIMLPWIVPTALSSLGWFMIFDPVFSPISWLMIEMDLIELTNLYHLMYLSLFVDSCVSLTDFYASGTDSNKLYLVKRLLH